MADQDYSDEKTPFDMGISTLQRINYWLYHANEHGFNSNVEPWFKSLLVLFRESYPFMNDAERKEHDKIKARADIFFKEYLKYMRNFDIIKKRNRYVSYNPPEKIFLCLDYWDKKLRALLKKKGLLMREGEDLNTVMLG